MIDVVLSMQDVVLYQELKGNWLPRPNKTNGLCFILGDVPDGNGNQGVVLCPGIDNRQPRHLLVSVGPNPLILSVRRTSIFGLDRGRDKTDVIVNCGIDQVPQFFAGGPTGFASRANCRPVVRKGAEMGKLCLDEVVEEMRQSLRHALLCHTRRRRKRMPGQRPGPSQRAQLPKVAGENTSSATKESRTCPRVDQSFGLCFR